MISNVCSISYYYLFSNHHGSAYGNHHGANNAHHANAAHSQSGNHYDKDSYVHHEVSLESEMYTRAYNPVLEC